MVHPLKCLFVLVYFFWQYALCACLFLPWHFSVKQTAAKDSDGAAVSCSLPLAVKPLEKSPTYDIAEEDPSVYSDKEDLDVGFVLQREWKEVPLPSKPKEEDDTFQYLVEAQ